MPPPYISVVYLTRHVLSSIQQLICDLRLFNDNNKVHVLDMDFIDSSIVYCLLTRQLFLDFIDLTWTLLSLTLIE